MQSRILNRFRRFRFSLRTLLLAVVGVCAWLGYYMNWIYERRAMLSQVESPPVQEEVEKNGVNHLVERPPDGPFPWPLRLLGEKPRTLVVIPGKKSDQKDQGFAEKISRLFPEASVQFDSGESFRCYDEEGNIVAVDPDPADEQELQEILAKARPVESESLTKK
jgi:hypothetical protein